MNRDDVAKMLGVQGKTVSTYLYESGEEIGRPDAAGRRRRGRYAGHPFPAPDGYNGMWPWWDLARAVEIREWAATRVGKGVGGGRPRSE